MKKNGSNLGALHKNQQQKRLSEQQMLVRTEKALGTEAPTKNPVARQVELMRNRTNGANKNMTWESLNGVYDAIARGFLQFSMAVKDNLNAVIAAGKSSQEFERVVLTSVKDCEVLSHELVAIKKLHEGKKGFVTDANDLPMYYQCGVDYSGVYAKFQQLALATGTEITTMMSAVVTANDPTQNLETVVNTALDASKEPVAEVTLPQEEIVKS